MLNRCLLLVFSIFALDAISIGQNGEKQAKIGFDATSIDRAVDPCVDFYQYACGNWIKNNPLPSDLPSYDRFQEMYERNRLVLKDILETSSSTSGTRTPLQQKIGDFYGACMDEGLANQRRIAPLDREFSEIDRMRTKDDLVALLASRHRKQISGFFGFGSQQDALNSSKVIGAFGQGGLGLPSKDYYLDTTEDAKGIRTKYVTYMKNMWRLAGETQEQADHDAQVVLRIETTLAKGSLNREERRDPKRLYNIRTIAELQALTPAFDFKKYLVGIGAPSMATVNVAMPSYYPQLQEVISSSSVEDLKTYLRWHSLNDAAPRLSQDFVEESFDFNQRTLLGSKELRPRWKRCVGLTDNVMGEATGMEFVRRTFGEDGKQRMLVMVRNLEKALEQDIQQVDWMTSDTKKRALEKLHVIENKIGYPDHPRDYATVRITRDDALGNVQQVAIYEQQRDLNKIGKPVDKSDWELTPTEVNANFEPQQNNINFPAGILQPPLFDRDMDDAVNYGGIGTVIGHELTHGFDDEGRQYDAHADLKDWWTKADAQAFEERASCIVKQYGQFAPVPDQHINGKLTLGENVADNGGARIAYNALATLISKNPEMNKMIDGFTPEQRFFLGFAQGWCANSSDEFKRLVTKTDEHSYDDFRIKGTVSNMPEFRKAFGCRVGQPMAPAEACRVW